MSNTTDYAFLHGGGQGSWVWDDTIDALRLQGGDSVGRVTLDIPGCGRKRNRRTEHLTPEDVARELIADLEAAGMERVVLVGHSLGGNVLPAVAELRPVLFRRLIYVSCSIPLEGQTVIDMMGSGVHGSDDNQVGWPVDPKTTPMRERYAQMYCNDMSLQQREWLLSRLDQDHWPAQYFRTTRFTFANIGSVPSSYVVCLRDRILPVTWQQKFAERFHAERIVSIDAGHQVMITRPHALAETIRQEAANLVPSDK